MASQEIIKVVDEMGREVIVSVSEKSIIRSYRGRPGCMCGCKGEYSNRTGLGIRRIQKIKKLCEQYGALPRMLYDQTGGQRIICLPHDLERELNVNYTVYIR